jgi:integrase
VRAFEDVSRGAIFLEFYDRTPITGQRVKQRVSVKHADREKAKAQAEELAAKLRTAGFRKLTEPTLAELFDIYVREVTPAKGAQKQKHDKRAIALFIACFGGDREPSSLNRRDWDRFISQRRCGALRPPGIKKAKAVGEQIIAYDLKCLTAILNWAVVSRYDGRVLLERNPLQGLPYPREESPARPVLSPEDYSKLLGVAEQVHEHFALALVVAHETGHRISSIRQLRWSDIGFDKDSIRWRAETDKIGFEHEPPASEQVLGALDRARRAAKAIGDAWVFPATEDASLPCPRTTFNKWWQRAVKLAELPAAKRRGWHSLRRLFATETKDLPLKDQAYLGGWKSPQTLLAVYQRADETTMREGLARRDGRRVQGIR